MEARLSKVPISLLRVLQLLSIGVTEMMHLVRLVLDDPVEEALGALSLIGIDRSSDGGVARLLEVGFVRGDASSA
jgi:hypothetical protein